METHNKIYIDKLEEEHDSLEAKKEEIHRAITDFLSGGSFHGYQDTFNKHVSAMLAIEKRFPNMVTEEARIKKKEAESVENNRYVLDLYKQLESLNGRLREDKRRFE